MIKKTILCTLGLFFGLGTATAQVRQNVFGVELGSHNTALYDLSLGSHFSVSTRAGFGLGLGFSTKKDAEGKRVAFGGIIPFANIEPRWHFSSKSSSDVYHTGGYLSLRFGADWDRMTLFGPSYPRDMIAHNIRSPLVPTLVGYLALQITATYDSQLGLTSSEPR